jgi:hypothetical protein
MTTESFSKLKLDFFSSIIYLLLNPKTLVPPSEGDCSHGLSTEMFEDDLLFSCLFSNDLGSFI